MNNFTALINETLKSHNNRNSGVRYAGKPLALESDKRYY